MHTSFGKTITQKSFRHGSLHVKSYPGVSDIKTELWGVYLQDYSYGAFVLSGQIQRLLFFMCKLCWEKLQIIKKVKK